MTPTGYDPDFLAVPLALPVVGAGHRVRSLDYVHFTVVLDTDRRLARVTGVNIDGASLVEIERDDDWRVDPRVHPAEQAGPALYAANDLDRGHLVRRRDPIWGPHAVAEQAGADTFFYTNAAPQAARFNQSKELWLGLEDYILDHAELHDRRLSVFTAPVLGDDDPVYRSVGIPQRFWKIAAWVSGDTPACTAYVLNQSPQLDDIELDAATARAAAAGDPPPLGAFRTFQVPVSDIGDLTGLQLDDLAAADRFVPARSWRSADERGWVRLREFDAISL